MNYTDVSLDVKSNNETDITKSMEFNGKPSGGIIIII